MTEKYEGLTNILILAGNSRHNVVKTRPLRSSSYANNKKFYLQICVGSNIARELGWKDGDYINVESNSTRNFVLLKNIDKNKNEFSEYWPIKGYIFRKIHKSYSYSINLPYFCEDSENLKNKVVDHEIINEKGNKFLKVYLIGRKENETID